jgi:outer membrane protein TolC
LFRFGLGLMAIVSLSSRPLCAQQAPVAADRPWDGGRYAIAPCPSNQSVDALDTDRTYSIVDLIELAEERNPRTRQAWQLARRKAADLGIARSDFFPTLIAGAAARTTHDGVLLNDNFVLQTIGRYDLSFSLTYTLLDFGECRGKVDQAKARLLASNFNFDDTHLQLVYQVLNAYYSLQQAQGEVDAAQAKLESAQTVRAAAEARLQQGLATVPDVLEARSAEVRASYDLETARGAQQVASGSLAVLLNTSPTTVYSVQKFDTLVIPTALDDTAEDAITRSLAQRPDLLAKREQVKAAQGEVTSARSQWYPRLAFSGAEGYLRAYGQQDPFPAAYAGGNAHSARLSLTWTVFDGGRRRKQVADAVAAQNEAQESVANEQNLVSEQVWQAYVDVHTAFRQRQSAASLLTATTESYNAAIESYQLGVRNLIDLLAAENELARARSLDVTARVSVLQALAALGLSTGDLLKTSARRPGA